MTYKDFLIFLVPLAAMSITAGIKIVLFSIKHGWKTRNLLMAFSFGHMPSTHTATVTSLVTSVGYYEGVNSGSFAIALILAIIIINDSLQLRVHMGDHGRYLNMLIRQLPLDEKKFPLLKERIGHRVSEVIVGGILGVTLAMLFANAL